MNFPPTGQHVAPIYRPHRQRSDYQYQVPVPHQQYYPHFQQAPPYAVPHPAYNYQPPWYPQYPQYAPQPPRFYQPPPQPSPFPPQARPPHAPPPPFIPQHQRLAHTPQPVRTPQLEASTPSTTSQAVTSPSTTPTAPSASTSTPPAPTPKPSSTIPIAPSPALSNNTVPPEPSIKAPWAPVPGVQIPWYPQLPWYSTSESDFPPRSARRRRRRKQAQSSALENVFPSRDPLPDAVHGSLAAEDPTTAGPSLNDQTQVPSDTTPPPPEASTTISTQPSLNETSSSAATEAISDVPVVVEATQPAPSQHRRSATKPVLPIIPILPRIKAQPPPAPASLTSPPADPVEAAPQTDDKVVTQETTSEAVLEPAVSSPPAPAAKAPPKSWAELFARGPAAVNAAAIAQAEAAQDINGAAQPKSTSLVDVLQTYNVDREAKLPFLEPRGLINTGNMCYMNSVLQVLVSCVPFYDFLELVAKRVAHSFKSDTPLVESMIMFMREYPVIDSAVSVEQLRMRLKDAELEQYGEPFSPEYVYDVIKRLPRFSSMRRGHQQDAEEFLGFLLEGLHDECVHFIKSHIDDAASLNGLGLTSPVSERSEGTADGGWLEVGPKQKASVTRSSGLIVTESPVTKIFGGKLRSVLRVPGLKDSVTLEPYQPLQLDIGAPNVNNITDALKGLTHSEVLTGEFNSPRGPGTTATKQVFIETLPPVLILHLKRFQYDNAGGTQKIWRKIGYPLDLEIPKEVFPQHQRANLAMRPGGLPKYRLISVVYHHGKSASGGHYTVDVRRQDGREWIRIDDTIIRRIRAEDVAHEGSEEDPKILAKALEQHKRDESAKTSTTNMFNAAFGGPEDDDEEQETQGEWSQVNGASPTTSSKADKEKAKEMQKDEGRKWSSMANGTTGSATPNTSTTGRTTPKASAKFSVKDNKVAYILFYQRVNV